MNLTLTTDPSTASLHSRFTATAANDWLLFELTVPHVFLLRTWQLRFMREVDKRRSMGKSMKSDNPKKGGGVWCGVCVCGGGDEDLINRSIILPLWFACTPDPSAAFHWNLPHFSKAVLPSSSLHGIAVTCAIDFFLSGFVLYMFI